MGQKRVFYNPRRPGSIALGESFLTAVEVEFHEKKGWYNSRKVWINVIFKGATGSYRSGKLTLDISSFLNADTLQFSQTDQIEGCEDKKASMQYTVKLWRQADLGQTSSSTRQSIGGMLASHERLGFEGEPIFEEPNSSQLENSAYRPGKLEILQMQERPRGVAAAGSRSGSATSTQRNHSPRRTAPATKPSVGPGERSRFESTAQKKTYSVEYREVLTHMQPKHSLAVGVTQSIDQTDHGLSKTIKTGHFVQTEDFSVCPKYLACTTDFEGLPVVREARSPRANPRPRVRVSPGSSVRRPSPKALPLVNFAGFHRDTPAEGGTRGTAGGALAQQHEHQSTSTTGTQRVHGVYQSERFDFIQSYNEMVVKLKLLEKENRSLRMVQDEVKDERGPAQLAVQRQSASKGQPVPAEFNHLSPIAGEKGLTVLQAHTKTPITAPMADRHKDRYERTEGHSSVAFQLSSSTEKKEFLQHGVSQQSQPPEASPQEVQLKNPDMNRDIHRLAVGPSPSKTAAVLFEGRPTAAEHQEREQLQQSKQAIEGLQRDKETLMQQLAELRGQMTVLKYAQVEAAQQPAAAAGSGLEQSQSRLHELAEEAARLEVQNASLQNDKERLVLQLEEITRALQTRESELVRAQQRVEQLETALQAARDEWQGQPQAGPGGLGELQAKVQQLETEKAGLREELDQYKNLLGMAPSLLGQSRKTNRHSRSFHQLLGSGSPVIADAQLNRRLSMREGTTSPDQELENLGELDEDEGNNNYQESISAQVKQIQEIALNLGTPGKRLHDQTLASNDQINLNALSSMGLNNPENKSLVERILACQAVIIQMLKRENKDLAAEYKNKYSSWNNEKEELKLELERARISERDATLKLSQAVDAGARSALEVSKIADSANLGTLIQQKAELKFMLDKVTAEKESLEKLRKQDEKKLREAKDVETRMFEEMRDTKWLISQILNAINTYNAPELQADIQQILNYKN